MRHNDGHLAFGNGWLDASSVDDSARSRVVASSSEIRAMSQATHDSPKFAASLPGRIWGLTHLGGNERALDLSDALTLLLSF